MNQAVQITPERRSVIGDMATRFGMEPRAFEATVRAMCIKPDKNGRVATPEEFAAFLLVAKNYNLNPLTKEIYAFTDNGRVIPIVSIDGWANLVNSHPQFDGMNFLDTVGENGAVSAITCSMFRKDRNHPTEVTEYMVECKRDTIPWNKWPRRMLRHKAMIQAARYSFGFAGIYDPDEGERIVSARDVSAPALGRPALSPPPPPDPSAPAKKASPPDPGASPSRLPPDPGKAASGAPKPQETAKPKETPKPAAEFSLDAFHDAMMKATTREEMNEIYEREVTNRRPPLTADEMDECDNIAKEADARFWKEEE